MVVWPALGLVGGRLVVAVPIVTHAERLVDERSQCSGVKPRFVEQRAPDAVSQHERGYLRHITQGCLRAAIDSGKRYSCACHHLVGTVAIDASGQREIGDRVEDLIGDAGTREAKPRVLYETRNLMLALGPGAREAPRVFFEGAPTANDLDSSIGLAHALHVDAQPETVEKLRPAARPLRDSSCRRG